MAIVIRMPEVLTGATEAALQSWLVKPGDTIAVGQTIAEVETEKATVEYQAEEAGTLAGVLIETGVQVDVGTPIAVLAEAGESADAALAAAGKLGAAVPTENSEDSAAAVDPAAAVKADAPANAAANAPGDGVAAGAATATDQSRRFASPLVRRLARERGLDLSAVTGSGPSGRIVRRDLDGLAVAPTAPAAQASAAPAVPTGGFTDVPHTGMRRAIARRLTESKSTIPHYYLSADCRVDALLELRKTVNEFGTDKVSVNDFVVKAVAGAFRDVPEANAIWTDTAIRRFDDVDIAIAVAIEGGLITPVVRAVDKRSLSEVSADIRQLAERGRTGGLKQHELEGGSFSVSNLGMYGTTEFSAIINPPHSGILAVGAATQRPVVVDDELNVATVMTVTLSADHRVLDGALAAQWLAAFVKRIENPVSILV
ncbi:pyruvate dehydrogenase complex dihydrolipoamide acetyltransferase [Cryobacterium sp. BB307]|uniref:pyruvate dehydrogenase complex dihydrolipoamide acetyltransferase n=1 Tax=Cryobacterium sp. BB307 TaxID=2716317 RepID=UPI00144523E9|nr:pyruvate dehydrogenase complex dihydrolipoamide acetyltransferase [Cryobacterium sp. BB307]